MPIIFLFPSILHSVNVPVYQDYLYYLISSFHPRKMLVDESRKEEKRRANKEREKKRKRKEFQQVIGTKTKEPSLDSN